LYGRRDAAVKLSDAAATERKSSNNGDSIARLLAAATSAELAALSQSPDSKKQSRNANGKARGIARNFFWGCIKVFGAVYTLTLSLLWNMFNNCFDVIFTKSLRSMILGGYIFHPVTTPVGKASFRPKKSEAWSQLDLARSVSTCRNSSAGLRPGFRLFGCRPAQNLVENLVLCRF